MTNSATEGGALQGAGQWDGRASSPQQLPFTRNVGQDGGSEIRSPPLSSHNARAPDSPKEGCLLKKHGEIIVRSGVGEWSGIKRRPTPQHTFLKGKIWKISITNWPFTSTLKLVFFSLNKNVHNYFKSLRNTVFWSPVWIHDTSENYRVEEWMGGWMKVASVCHPTLIWQSHSNRDFK